MVSAMRDKRSTQHTNGYIAVACLCAVGFMMLIGVIASGLGYFGID